ncbi:MAG TPA: YkoF family thiamine/hydroxymethylpyrimidine-binding protein [Brevefilum fermentans]|jgi:uncharacterized protein YqgV (UPF0045/DUF77 family)|uniref:Thiamin/hydroxymethyl pyrimidine-binding YkoF putative domain-containing protein n=1 Tax=Candidatus Brevifilum fermentans TaxID=1986204 RepID=A0A1Y6K554_9CHLR|nr:YkoF family thiamine/hydroxymethylpyrimidine-binding protein [Brevefilum fermentans]MDI9566122.1 YkoF family thiamine/hydroxymethylpyrimidine-binding protein [Chloroflexota bacterium]OQB84294.1 MAG: YKOF-related Family protein [Chloroflexi bacterium ADurb.Bin120]SMX54706.1 conserved protein of unknown function [Brevefilum fermentans]HPX96264.1 YkoF family thiamine/hydroxymethylpyrimidine-binding protein [Brevefilum fermentans]HQA29309.1 YkoF family thiamine/hydroxymethylpyrimidine-binding p
MLEGIVLTALEAQAIKEKIEAIKRSCEIQEEPHVIIEGLNELLPLLTGEDLIEKRFITAQFSLYPLRQSSLSQTINLALDALEDFNLKTQPGSMSTVISGTQRAVWGGLQGAFSNAASQAEVVMVVTISNAC